MSSGEILSIQNIGCETLGTLESFLIKDRFKITNILAAEEKIPLSSKTYSAIIILGGPMSVYDNKSYLLKEQELVRDAVKNSVPVLGICLGSQLIAQALGGKVYKGEKKEIGWKDITITHEGSKGIFKGLENKLRVFQWHGDTYQLPAGSINLAYSELYPQAFRIGSAIGVQFHLEVNSEMIKRWIQEYAGEIKTEKISLDEILNDKEEKKIVQKCQILYNNFLKEIKKK